MKDTTIMLTVAALLFTGSVAAQDYQRQTAELKQEMESLHGNLDRLSRMLDRLEGREIAGQDILSETEYFSLVREGLPDLTVGEEEYFQQLQETINEGKTPVQAIKLLETYIAYFPSGRYVALVKNDMAIRKFRIALDREESEFRALTGIIKLAATDQEKIDSLNNFLVRYPGGARTLEARVLLSDLLKKQLNPVVAPGTKGTTP